MITLMRHTAPGCRHRLRAAKRGLVLTYERTAVGGGYYVRDHLEIPYPWFRLDAHGNIISWLDKLRRR